MSALVLVQNYFLENGAKVVSLSGYNDEKSGEFTLNLCCDLKGVRMTPDNLVEELKKMSFVRYAVWVNMKDQFFDGLIFPITLMDTIRVVAIKSDMTFQIEDRLKTPAEKSALFEVGRTYCLEIIEQIMQKLDRSVPDRIVKENMMAYLRATGWGTFRHESSADMKADRILVQDPPTSKTGEAAGNHFIQGMAAGIVEAFERRKSFILEDSYDKTTRLLSLTLMEELAPASPMRLPARRRRKSKLDSAEIKPLKAVENTIIVKSRSLSTLG